MNINTRKKNPDKLIVEYFFYSDGWFTRFDIIKA